MADWAKDALDWDSDDEALMQEAKAQGCRQLTLLFVIIAAALACALAVCLLSLASCRADWADFYKRQEEARDAIRGYGGDVCGSVPRPRDRSGARRMDWWGFPQAA